MGAASNQALPNTANFAQELVRAVKAKIINMKKLVLILASAALLGTVTSQAEEKKKPTPEQKAGRKAMLDKYDTNKDGKLDKEERAKVSAEDKEKMQKAGGEHHKKKK